MAYRENNNIDNLEHFIFLLLLKAKPKINFTILLLCLASFGFFAIDFRLDASSETLYIDGDPDLKYLREITERYNSKEFLVLTYTPNEDKVSENSIYNLLSLNSILSLHLHNRV